MNTKQELLAEVRAGRERLMKALAPYDAAAMETTLLPNGWSVKDILAHIGHWEEKVVEIYYDLVRGETPDMPDPADPDDVNRVNAQVYDRYHNRPASDIQVWEATAYQNLLDFVEKIPESDLFDPQRFPWLRSDLFA